MGGLLTDNCPCSCNLNIFQENKEIYSLKNGNGQRLLKNSKNRKNGKYKPN